MQRLAACRRSMIVAAALMSVLASKGVAQTAKPTAQRGTNMEYFQTLKWDTTHQGREIDLAQYRRTFTDDFKAMSIVKQDSDPSAGKWFSPGHGAYQSTCPLRADGPFTLVDDGLRARVEKVGQRWLGACMQSVNTKGQGFAQQYGYFEMTTQYEYTAAAKGIWAGLWLKSQQDYFTDGTTTRTEIDINEFYGDNAYHPTAHLWPAAKLAPDATITKHVFASGFKQKIAPRVFEKLMVDGVVKGFHTYGGEITPEWVIMYFDRKELGRFPTMPEWKTPLYMLVSSDRKGIKPGQPEPDAPIDMTIRNVSAYLPITPYVEP